MRRISTILVSGVRCSGKGTYGRVIAEALNWQYLSVGDILRRRGASGDMALTKVHEPYGAASVNAMIARTLSEVHRSNSGLVLDGAPRTVGQLSLVDDWCDVKALVWLRVGIVQSIRRARVRLLCVDCSWPGNVMNDRCPLCGGRMQRRKDDALLFVCREWLRFRLHTLEVIEAYAQRGKVLVVETGRGSVGEVATAIMPRIRQIISECSDECITMREVSHGER